MVEEYLEPVHANFDLNGRLIYFKVRFNSSTKKKDIMLSKYVSKNGVKSERFLS